MYFIEQGLKHINTNNGQEIVPSGNFTAFPVEIIVQIFQEMTNFRDFCVFALSNKFCYLIAASQNLPAANCPELVPYYFSHHAQASLHSLPIWKKVSLATRMENQFVSHNTVQPIFKKELSLNTEHCFNSFNTTIINDYLVLTSCFLPKGLIYLYSLKTGVHRSFQASDFKVILCMAIHTPIPCLVTANADGFKIWNFEQLLTSDHCEQALLFQKMKAISFSKFNHAADKLERGIGGKYFPIMAVFDHLLGVGYADHILIFDSNRSFEAPLLIDFEGVEQIEFFENHLMLVSHKKIAIWMRSTVLKHQAEEKVLTIQSALFTYTNYQGKSIPAPIAFAKVHKEKIVIAYEKGYVLRDKERNNLQYFKIGEVQNWKTGQAIRPLAYPCGRRCRSEFKSLDFKENFLFTASDFLCKWDLDDFGNPFEKSMHSQYCLTSAASKVYSIGSHVLFVLNRCLVIQKATDFSTQIEKEGTLCPISEGKDYYHQASILAFDLRGKYLITIIRNEKAPHKNDLKPLPILNVYDLSLTIDPIEKTVNDELKIENSG